MSGNGRQIKQNSSDLSLSVVRDSSEIRENMYLCGKVTGITSYGAFVKLLQNVSGMVHISEISVDRVDNISDYLQISQEIVVKVIPSRNSGKIALSIRQVPDILRNQ